MGKAATSGSSATPRSGSQEIDESDETSETSGFFVMGVAAIALLIIAGGFYGYHHQDFFLVPNPVAWGQFGDYFGGVLNPIFGLLAFLALLFTIHLQLVELRVTRNTNTAQMEELRLAQKWRTQDALFRDLENAIRLQAEVIDDALSDKSNAVPLERMRFLAKNVVSISKDGKDRSAVRLVEQLNSSFLRLANVLNEYDHLAKHGAQVMDDRPGVYSNWYTNTWRLHFAEYAQVVASVFAYHEAVFGDDSKKKSDDLRRLFNVMDYAPKYTSWKDPHKY